MSLSLNRSEWWDDAGNLTDIAVDTIHIEAGKRLAHRCPYCQSDWEGVRVVYRLSVLVDQESSPDRVIPAITLCCESCGAYLLFNVQMFFKKTGH